MNFDKLFNKLKLPKSNIEISNDDIKNSDGDLGIDDELGVGLETNKDNLLELINDLTEYYKDTDDNTGLMYMDLLEYFIGYSNVGADVYDTLMEILGEGLDEILGNNDLDDDQLEEAKKVKINKIDRLARKKLYRRNKAKLKKVQKRYRKTAQFKRQQKKKKRMAKRGKTSTGKRISKFI